MESEQSQNFNERMSQWVASQGFWFQIRHSMFGSGKGGTVFYHFLRLGTRLLVFLLLVTAGLWVYLLKRTESAQYAVDLKDSIQSALRGSETEISGFARKRGRLEMASLIGEGGSGTFYNTLDARNIRCNMGVLDGVTGKWNPGPISISSLKLELRPGADDADSAKAFSKALFSQNEKFLASVVEVPTATIFWGYTDRTRGSIENSDLRINRIGNGLRMTFTGGTFSQNWLKNLQIVSLVALVDSDGVTFEKAEFRRGRGEVDLTGLRLTGGERPTVSGTAKIRTLALDSVLPPVLRNFLEGTFSGDFKVSGSTNSAEGIGFEGLVTLDGRDTIVIRERLPLLEALSVVDYVRNYHRLEFQSGSFRVKTGNGEVKISDLKLKSQEIFTLEGGLLVRPPTAEEKADDAAKPQKNGAQPAFAAGSNFVAGSTFALNDPSAAAQLGLDRSSKKPLPLVGRLAAVGEARQAEILSSEQALQFLRYEGSFVVTLLPDSFELAPKLLEKFPVDPKTNRIPLVVPIRGTISQLTEEQAKEIYQQRTR